MDNSLQIGKVNIDLSKYSGQDFYSEGEIEDKLLEVAETVDRSEFRKTIEDNTSWPYLYHFSKNRENIVSWLPLKKSDKVLEVGAGMGAITNALCHVDAGGGKNNMGEKLAVEIEQEGIVLAKNENGTLPLSKDVKKVNVFGHSVVDWLISNSGSGSAGPGSSQKSVGLLDALTENGIEYNTDIIDFYKTWCAPRDLPFSIQSGYDSLYRLAEPSLSYTDGYQAKFDAAKEYSNTAIVCLSRVAGEHIDPPHEQINKYKAKNSKDASRGYLEISTEEEELLTAVGQAFEKVIVVINSSNTMQMDFIRNIEGLDSCLLVGPTGTVGARAIPQVIYGDINPSGRTADTWPMKHQYNPAYYTSGYWPSSKGPFYTGTPSGANLKSMNSSGDGTPNVNFADYVEGIYVGYRWYETADAEGYWDRTEYGGYDKVVAFPFGHGLSYTNFDWEIIEALPISGSNLDGTSDITVDVKVTNKGEVAGRDVVEAYLTAPYIENEIEKPVVKLVGFQKTPLIQPGASEIIRLNIHQYDFASFDSDDYNNNGNKGYELDAGNYQLKLMTSAHCMKENMGANGNTLTYKVDTTINNKNDTVTGNEVKALFSDDSVDGIRCDGKDADQNINFFKRSSFKDSSFKIMTELNPNRAWSEKLNTSLNKEGHNAPNAYSRQDAAAWDNATGSDAFGREIPTDNPTWRNPSDPANEDLYVLDQTTKLLSDVGRTLAEDYDADEWEDVLDQCTFDDSMTIINNSSSYNRPGVKSVGLGQGVASDYKDVEAASQVGVDLEGNKRLTAYPTPTVQAQCWNPEMPYQFGLSEAKDMIVGGADASYGPASNIHRTPYGGRSSEYHSEDGFLAGRTLAAVTKGLSDGGKTGFIKHFAVNDTEYHRVGLYTWLTEQALREVYLRPFEEAVKRGEATAVMTSFNRVGATWAGGSEAMIQGVLRNEWGFKGMIITDMIESNDLMDISMHLRAGANYVLGGSGYTTGSATAQPTQATASPRLQWRLRENLKQVIYAHIRVLYLNELYNENPNSGEKIVVTQSKQPYVWWKPALDCVEALAYVGTFFGLFAILWPHDAEFRTALFEKIGFKKKED